MRRAAGLCSLLVLASLARLAVAEAQAPAEPAPAPAAQAPAEPAPTLLGPKLSTQLTPNTLQVGEVAKLQITVDAPTTSEVSLPEQSFGGLELVDRHVRSVAQGARTITTYELDLLALEAGKIELPALTLRFVSVNGELSSAQTAPQTLQVRSLIANEPNAEPKPATQPVSVMRDDYTVAWVGLGLLAVALIALATLLIARWLKRRPKAVAPPPPPRPAWELAIERLHALLAQKDALFASDRGEEFVDGVSDALREYLGRRYGFDGLERTTGELVQTLTKLRPHKLSLEGVSQLLDACDLVKFARAKPDQDDCQDLWNGAIGLIRATTPQQDPTALAPLPSQPPPASLAPPPPRASLAPPPPRASLAPQPPPAAPPRAEPRPLHTLPWETGSASAAPPPAVPPAVAPPAPWDVPPATPRSSIPPPPRTPLPPPARGSLPPPSPKLPIPPPPPPAPRDEKEEP